MVVEAQIYSHMCRACTSTYTKMFVCFCLCKVKHLVSMWGGAWESHSRNIYEHVVFVCFSQDQLRGRSFTFWEWFYKHLDLIKSTLKREWMEG